VAWGYNYDGQTNVPAGLNNVVAIAAGGNEDCGHSLALKNDGTVVAWGNNDFGQTNVPADLSNIIAISAGGYYNLALCSDGSIVSWVTPTPNKLLFRVNCQTSPN
jgi:alpha-tubulin suppressor-like RCC1 family protein